MAKSPKSKSTTKRVSTAKVVKIEKTDETKKTANTTNTKTPVKAESNKPRIRKTETIRERNYKLATKAEAKADKKPKTKVKKAASKVAKPFKKPARVVAKPFRTKPARFIGRIFGRILWPKYFRNSWTEIKQVTWPTRRDTWKLTFAVIAFALVFGLAAYSVDFVLDKIIERIVFRG